MDNSSYEKGIVWIDNCTDHFASKLCQNKVGGFYLLVVDINLL